MYVNSDYLPTTSLSFTLIKVKAALDKAWKNTPQQTGSMRKQKTGSKNQKTGSRERGGTGGDRTVKTENGTGPVASAYENR